MNIITFEKTSDTKRNYSASIFDTEQSKVVCLGRCWFDDFIEGWVAAPVFQQNGIERTGIAGIVGFTRQEVAEKLLRFAARAGRVKMEVPLPRIIGANATIYWEDTNDELQCVYISFGTEVLCRETGDCERDEYGIADAKVFFYGNINDEDKYRNGGEGWILLSWDLVEQ